MKPNSRQLVVGMLLISLQYVSVAQQRAHYAAWLLPGITWRYSTHGLLLGQAGYNPYLGAAIVYPQTFITIHNNIVLNPAYLFFVQQKEGTGYFTEHDLMHSVIVKMTRKKFFAESRNMIWNRITVGAVVKHYYRNRLKAGFSFKTGVKITRIYAYDELYYFFNSGALTRNRIAAGISSDLTSSFSTEITYVHQYDRYSGNLRLFFIQVTWQW